MNGPPFEVSDATPGPDEEAWLAAMANLDLAELDEAPPARVVMVAPHPDDEVLGVGGLVSGWSRGGSDVTVVAVTDGERGGPTKGARERHRLAHRRRRESLRAQRRLGGAAGIQRLSVPDGQVSEHVDAVADAVAARLQPDSWCVVTWRGDGHPDHEASGAAAAAAAAAVGARLIEFPVWMWHWAGTDDVRVPWHRARLAFLDAATLLAKRAALREFRSQIRPPQHQIGSAGGTAAALLPPYVLDRFRRPFEVVFI